MRGEEGVDERGLMRGGGGLTTLPHSPHLHTHTHHTPSAGIDYYRTNQLLTFNDTITCYHGDHKTMVSMRMTSRLVQPSLCSQLLAMSS